MSNEKLQPYETKMQKSLDALEREYTIRIFWIN